MRFHALCALSCLTLMRLHTLCSAFFVWDILRDFHAFCGPLRAFFMRFHAFGCMIFEWDFLMRVHAFCYISCLWDFMLFGPLRDFLMRFRFFLPWWDFLMRFYAFCCSIFVQDIPMRFHAFWGRFELCVWDFMLVRPFLAAGFSFWSCDVRTVERRMWEIECTRWFIGRCVVLCASWVIRWRGMNVRVVWKLYDSCHQHALHQVDTYILVIQGGWFTRGFGLVEWCM
jgi:hypothetical protein